MGKHLVLVGGGHAHMVTLANLHTFIEKGHKVTVIGPSDYHYYSGMGPGMLGKTYTPDDIRFATRDVAEKKGGTLFWARRKLLIREKGWFIWNRANRFPTTSCLLTQEVMSLLTTSPKIVAISFP